MTMTTLTETRSASISGQLCSNCGTTSTPLWRRDINGKIICNACGLYEKARQTSRPATLKRRQSVPTTTTSSVTISKDIAVKPDIAPVDSSAAMANVGASPTIQHVARGTCPGDGHCDGTGGNSTCSGCPAFNNRVAKAAQAAAAATIVAKTGANGSSQYPDIAPGPKPASTTSQTEMQCQNCGTTNTPLWRRDEDGKPICNACGLYHKLHGEHRPIQMKKTVIKRRKRIVPTNYSSNIQRPASTSSNSPSPPPNHSPRLAANPYGPLPPLWASQQTNTRTSYSPEPTDFTNYRPYSCATFPSSYNQQNTLPPLRLPVGHHPQPISPIQHVGNAIPLPKRKLESPDMDVKRARLEDVDPLEGARVLLTLGSRESVIRKKAELLGEIEIIKEKLEKLQKAVGECDEFLGKA